jgi:hypothetical protein
MEISNPTSAHQRMDNIGCQMNVARCFNSNVFTPNVSMEQEHGEIFIGVLPIPGACLQAQRPHC